MKTPQDQSQLENSVFDFIYVDLERISLLLTQFNQLGSVEEISQNKEATRSSGESSTYDISGNAILAKLESQQVAEIGKCITKTDERRYNPRWKNALMFMDYAESANLINRDLSAARIGDLILTKGKLKIRDLSALAGLWKKKSLQAFMQPEQPEGNRAQRRKDASGAKISPANKMPSEVDILLDVIDLLPHTVQAIITSSVQSWGILRNDYLIGSPSDFALKFGGNIPGEWAMLGILEALPGGAQNPGGVIPTALPEDVYDVLAMHLEPLTRQFVGRPSRAFGVTPLIILREVSPKP